MASRKRVHEILEVAHPGDRTSRLVDIAILSLIVLNVVALIVESVEEYRVRYEGWLAAFEYFSVVAFSLEYVLRVWSCVENDNYAHPIFGRLRFMFTPQALIDLLAVLPFYIDVGLDGRFVRVLRLLKLARYIEAMRVFHNVLTKKRYELLATLIVLGVMLVFTACLMHVVERAHNPKFDSIPSAMWWSIVTLTTVGYGDAHPVTPFGKLLAGFVALLGIGMFALPTSILGAAFLEEMNSAREKKPKRCPHCKKSL